ncbi:B-cell differentiation antigen CD72-like [Gopherus evgoodei]|uniref:B-cell differentiation antigen CD72-like n=1 Tax=Gopherus evgoodei TaxID=1825980 RepID=UPI0011CF1225|nr:B-cell differentiation antigen CD72-like [Gopherus evgoodei]
MTALAVSDPGLERRARLSTARHRHTNSSSSWHIPASAQVPAGPDCGCRLPRGWGSHEPVRPMLHSVQQPQPVPPLPAPRAQPVPPLPAPRAQPVPPQPALTGHSQSLHSQRHRHSRSLLCQRRGHSQYLSSQRCGHSQSLHSQRRGHSRSLHSQRRGHSRSLLCRHRGRSRSLLCRHRGPSQSLSSQHRTGTASPSLVSRAGTAGPSPGSPTGTASPPMAQGVIYADLRFVKAPRGNSTSFRSQEEAPADEDDVELTYENIQLAQTGEVEQGQGAEKNKEPRWSTRYLPLGLLGTCLFLLATTIGLGVRYWQVSQHLQQASRVHEAESSRLSQQVSTKGATLAQMARELEQARRELGQAREELEQMQLEMNGTQEKLRQWEAALEGTKEELARVQEEKREIKEKLNQTKSALASIRPCEQTDCCPADWVLYRGKCLFISKEKTNWEESRKECEQKSAQLLIAKSWDTETTPNFLKHTGMQYWIGARRDWYARSQWKWLDDSPFEKG